jgi:dTDP-4-amino-4,6-dideoxygalactose transaminase
MINLDDYLNPFKAILDFEKKLCEYTGAPYCVTTDCCSHAIELAFRLSHDKTEVQFPAKTYISVLMTMHKVGVPYKLLDTKWRDCYKFQGSNIWDCARFLAPNMYVPETIQCLSFNRGKPLQIGRGGCILTDDEELYKAASRARSDGRDLFAYSPWQTQKTFNVGYHYILRPEECVRGLNLLADNAFIKQLDKDFDYPDCRQLIIES